MVPIGDVSTKSVLSDRWIVYTKSRKQLLQRKNLLYDTGCIWMATILSRFTFHKLNWEFKLLLQKKKSLSSWSDLQYFSLKNTAMLKLQRLSCLHRIFCSNLKYHVLYFSHFLQDYFCIYFYFQPNDFATFPMS